MKWYGQLSWAAMQQETASGAMADSEIRDKGIRRGRVAVQNLSAMQFIRDYSCYSAAPASPGALCGILLRLGPVAFPVAESKAVQYDEVK